MDYLIGGGRGIAIACMLRSSQRCDGQGQDEASLRRESVVGKYKNN